MTYEEAYRQCLTPEKILEYVRYDIACAMVTAMVTKINKTPIIIQAAEKVLQEKFPDFEGIIDT